MVSLEDLASPLVSRAALAFLPIVIFSYVSLRNKQNMTKNTDTPKRTIVVVGGGAAGSNLSRNLATKQGLYYNVILVTSRPHYTYLPAAMRTLVSTEMPLDSLFMPYDRLFQNTTGVLKIGSVTSIEEKAGNGGNIILSDGETISYDVLVLATGSTWDGLVAFPEEEKDYFEHVHLWRNKFKSAQDIVIMGGGAVGIETAGEIKDVYPTKSITIVQGEELLLNNTYPDKFRRDIEGRLRKRGINLLLGDFIDSIPQPDTPVVTRKGKTLPCNLLVPTRGGRPNTSFCASLDPSVLSDRGYVKVLPTLQVESHPSIFALGDIIEWPETKQFVKVYQHLPIVEANVIAYLKNKNLTKLYKGGPEMILITNGKNGGSSYFGLLWGLVFGDWFTSILKSKELLIGRTKKSIGL